MTGRFSASRLRRNEQAVADRGRDRALPDDEQRQKRPVRRVAEVQQRAGDGADRDRAQPIAMLAEVRADERNSGHGAETSHQPRHHPGDRVDVGELAAVRRRDVAGVELVEKVADRKRRSPSEDPGDYDAGENDGEPDRSFSLPQKNAEAEHEAEINTGQKRCAAERGEIVGVREVREKVRHQRGNDPERGEKERRPLRRKVVEHPPPPDFWESLAWRAARFTGVLAVRPVSGPRIGDYFFAVMAGLVPAIHVLASPQKKAWMPDIKPGMTGLRLPPLLQARGGFKPKR